GSAPERRYPGSAPPKPATTPGRTSRLRRPGRGGGMEDFVNFTDPTDRNAESTGCATAFVVVDEPRPPTERDRPRNGLVGRFWHSGAALRDAQRGCCQCLAEFYARGAGFARRHHLGRSVWPTSRAAPADRTA